MNLLLGSCKFQPKGVAHFDKASPHLAAFFIVFHDGCLPTCGIISCMHKSQSTELGLHGSRVTEANASLQQDRNPFHRPEKAYQLAVMRSLEVMMSG